MRQVYFSHSYRDEDLNAYFLHLLEGPVVNLVADRKSETWCVPKLERYMAASDGFLAVVPRRMQGSTVTVSPYILKEMQIARRAGIPCAIFVDDLLLAGFPETFAEDAVPFFRDSPPSDEPEHRRKIERFCEAVTSRPAFRPPPGPLRRASIFVGASPENDSIVDAVAETLADYNYRWNLTTAEEIGDCINDMSAIDRLLASEISVFCLAGPKSDTHLALAMAYALCKPAFRLVYDPHSASCEPDIHGVHRWSSARQLISELQSQLGSYRRGFLDVIGRERLKVLGVPEWDGDPWSLPNFVQVEDRHLRDDLYAVRRLSNLAGPI